jgi:hypothetical protein
MRIDLEGEAEETIHRIKIFSKLFQRIRESLLVLHVLIEYTG